MSPLDKFINNLTKRLDRLEPRGTDDADKGLYYLLMEAKFARQRGLRAKLSDGMDDSYDVFDSMTDEEKQYWKNRYTQEERYQTMKEMYYFHDSSSYMRFGDTRPDNYGCNSDACIPECDFYPATGNLDQD